MWFYIEWSKYVQSTSTKIYRVFNLTIHPVRATRWFALEHQRLGRDTARIRVQRLARFLVIGDIWCDSSPITSIHILSFNIIPFSPSGSHPSKSLWSGSNAFHAIRARRHWERCRVNVLPLNSEGILANHWHQVFLFLVKSWRLGESRSMVREPLVVFTMHVESALDAVESQTPNERPSDFRCLQSRFKKALVVVQVITEPKLPGNEDLVL